jgi:dihydropteroate synthase
MQAIESQSNMGPRPHVALWRTTRFELDLARPLVMGIVNVTPDSFFDGGIHSTTQAALLHAQRLIDEGADILDIGGESTRPGSQPLTADQEWQRIMPVLMQLIKLNIPLSVDTYHLETMQKAVDMGVDIVNDIWGLRQRGVMDFVAKNECGICVMHMHGDPTTMQLQPITANIMDSLNTFFCQQLALTDQMGIERNRLVLDPGIGFGKSVQQNFEILRQQAQLLELGLPLMMGWSNKSSLGVVSGLPVNQRLVPSIAAAILAVERGAKILRVHAVAETVAALSVWKVDKNLQDISS